MCKSGLSDMVVTFEEDRPKANSLNLLNASETFSANPEFTII